MFSISFFYVLVHFSLFFTGMGAVALVLMLIKDIKNNKVW